jgi:hypothetical protein
MALGREPGGGLVVMPDVFHGVASFAGIAPAGVLGFIAAQFVGMVAAVCIGAWLRPTSE